MVLINGQPVCTSCGASPSPDADPPKQEEHHHIGHTHEEAKEMPDDLAKLRFLLSHWIEHNQEHAESFQHWAARAREMGQDEAARQIEQAVERMAACNQALNAALQLLEV
jgi:hypothetical protein